MTDFKQPYPKPNPIHCSAQWHFSQSALMLCIYSLAGTLTAGGIEGRTFFVKPKKIAAHFGYGYDGVLRAIKMLRRQGWLIRQKGAKYAFVTHEEWVKTHPGKCCQRDLLPWQETLETSDPLVKRLYAVSTGKIRLNENFLNKFRTVDPNRLVELYVKELAAMKAKIERGGGREGTSNESCLWRCFRSLLSLQQNQVEKPPSTAD
jgi:hypothetical protein